MGDISSEIISYQYSSNDTSPTEGSLGLRYRGFQDNVLRRAPSLLTETYSDETCYSAAIEYVNDGDGNLLRDKPPEALSGASECEDEEAGEGVKGRVGRNGVEYDTDESCDSDVVKIGINGEISENSGASDDDEDDGELGGVHIVRNMRKASTDSFDFFDFDMISSFWEQFKHVGPKLVPFLKTLGLYFVIFIPDDRPSLFAMMIKCLPIVSLALFIVLHGIGLSEEHKFSRRILTGLVFSCLGDAFLIWPGYFLHGMAAFGVAQCFYIRAFGLQPLSLKTGLAVYTITGSSLVLILPALLTDSVPMLFGVLTYSFLLTTMLWRAIARVQAFSSPPDPSDGPLLPSTTNNPSTAWSKGSACVGALFFAVSDTILALNQFYTRIPYHQTLVMATYYLAQLGIALSVVTTKELKPKDDDTLQAEETGNGINDQEPSQAVRQRKAKAAI